jgi:hypothetical protein
MLRLLLVSLFVMGLFRSTVAQTCAGLASFDAPLQIAPYGSFADGVRSFGGRLGYGGPASAFGTVQVGTTSFDNIDESSLDLGAGLGYQLETGSVHVCPNVTGFYMMGPKNIALGNGVGLDISEYAVSGGITVGTAAGSSNFQVVPSVGFDVVYDKVKVEVYDDFASAEESQAETYGLATLGLGLVFSSTMSLRPTVAIPIGLDGSEAYFGLMVAFNVGPRSHSVRPQSHETSQLPATFQTTSPSPSPGYRLVDGDVPEGANFIAHARTRTYYPVGCQAAIHIPIDERLYYRSEDRIRTDGFTRAEGC